MLLYQALMLQYWVFICAMVVASYDRAPHAADFGNLGERLTLAEWQHFASCFNAALPSLHCRRAGAM